MPNNVLNLLPTPQKLIDVGGSFTLPDHQLIVLDSSDPQALRFAGRRVQQALQEHAGVDWSLVAGNAVLHDKVGLRISVAPNGTPHPQGYGLTITPDGVSIAAATSTGALYGALTLIQILQQRHNTLPMLNISDWPDYPNRGVMLDISRDKVPTMDTLFQLVDMLAGWKINQLQLYTEHTFAYQNHPIVWAEASPMTGEEILTLDAYCRERCIELVPNQNTFGHMRRWLIHDRYRPLAECPDGCDTGDPEWGYFDKPFTLCPGDPGTLDLVRNLMDELLPHFSSRQFNVGCDEPVELGKGKSAELVAQKGKARVYLEYLLKIYHEVKARGRTMQVWGDIITTYPELIPELPHDLLAMEWGYEAEDPFDENGAKYAASGIPFYVCPGTSSWNSVAGRTDNAVKNLRNAAENGLKHGAIGYLITDWGDDGHWQPLPVSYLGISYGAALGWAYNANESRDVAQTLNCHVFHDSNDLMGRLAYELGNADRPMEMQIHNNSILFRILRETPEEIRAREEVTTSKLQTTLAHINQIAAGLADIRLDQPDANLIYREYTWIADMLRHACRRGMWALDLEQSNLRKQLADEADHLIAEHQKIWLARNRVGGLKDSLAHLEKMRQAYV